MLLKQKTYTDALQKHAKLEGCFAYLSKKFNMNMNSFFF